MPQKRETDLVLSQKNPTFALIFNTFRNEVPKKNRHKHYLTHQYKGL